MAKDNNTLLSEILDAIQSGGGGGGGGGETFSIPVSSWQASENTTLGTSYKATVNLTITCNTQSAAVIYYDAAVLKHVNDCGIISDITADKVITFYSTSLPTIAVSGYIKIIATRSSS